MPPQVQQLVAGSRKLVQRAEVSVAGATMYVHESTEAFNCMLTAADWPLYKSIKCVGLNADDYSTGDGVCQPKRLYATVSKIGAKPHVRGAFIGQHFVTILVAAEERFDAKRSLQVTLVFFWRTS